MIGNTEEDFVLDRDIESLPGQYGVGGVCGMVRYGCMVWYCMIWCCVVWLLVLVLVLSMFANGAEFV